MAVVVVVVVDVVVVVVVAVVVLVLFLLLQFLTPLLTAVWIDDGNASLVHFFASDLPKRMTAAPREEPYSAPSSTVQRLCEQTLFSRLSSECCCPAVVVTVVVIVLMLQILWL